MKTEVDKLKAHVVRQTRYVERKRSAGYCARCATPSKKWRCKACEAKHNSEVKGAYASKRAQDKLRAEFAPLVEPIIPQD